MRSPIRGADGATRLGCESLEDRVTPAQAYALGGVGAGTATLLALDTARPGGTPTTVTGIDAGESLVGLDFRPDGGGLYALGVNPTTGDGTLYTIDPRTGGATAVGGVGNVDVNDGTDVPLALGGPYGFAFDPTADQLSVSTAGASFRLDPDSGLYLGSEAAGTTTGAAAYTNGRSGAAATTLYVLDAATDALYAQDADGTMARVGSGLGVDAATVRGFDIPEGVSVGETGALATGSGFAVLTVGNATGVYRIDLTAGTAELVRTVGSSTPAVQALALAPSGAVGFESATYTVAESGTEATVTLTRTGGTAGAIAASVSVAGGTATTGDDFTGGPYTVNFADGQTTASFKIPVADDAVAEGSETLHLVISVTGANGSVGAVSTAELTVTDNDSSVAFASATASGTEGPKGIDVVLTRTGGGTGAMSATVEVTGGTATAGADFAGGPYTVNFAEGQTTATLNIPFAGDGSLEGSETVALSVTAVTGDGAVATTSTTTLTVADQPQLFAQAYGTGGSIPSVGVRSSGDSTVHYFNPYGFGATGGVRVALGDVTGDGLTDLVTAPAAGAPLINVYSGVDGAQVASFYAYPSTVNIPVSLAVGDLNNDGRADIVLGTATTLGAVLVFSGETFRPMGAFLPFGAAPVGVNVAVGDTDGDGGRDIVVSTNAGLAVVGVFDGTTFAQQDLYLPFGTFLGGATVAAGDLDGDGRAEVVVGAAGTVPAVAVYNGRTPRAVFMPVGSAPGGVNVAVNDVNGDGRLDLVAGQTTGSGMTGAFDGLSLTPLDPRMPFGGFRTGVFVA